ncbi:hypothetical protein D3C75_1078540 [compost metagenome]
MCFCRENPWHGGPPDSRDNSPLLRPTSFRTISGVNSQISATLAIGETKFLYVFIAIGFKSKANRSLNPASFNPTPNPPAPQKVSIQVNSSFLLIMITSYDITQFTFLKLSIIFKIHYNALDYALVAIVPI